MRLANVMAGYWLDRDDLAKTTVEQYQYFYKLLQSYLPDDPEFEAITARQVKQFLSYLAGERGLSKKTAALCWAALASLWKWASKEIECENVVKAVPIPKYQAKLIEPYTSDQIKAMLSSAEYYTADRGGKRTKVRRATGLRDRAIILTLLDCGLRATELCNLKVGDYDQSRGRVMVKQGKGSKDRAVFAGKRTQKAIWRYLAERDKVKPTDNLFASSETGNRMDRNNLRKLLQRIGDHAGVEGVTVHRYRHTCAISLLRNGASSLAVQRVLGHEDLKTVLIYVKLAECDLEQVASAQSPADIWRL